MRSFPDLSGNVHFSRAHGLIVGQLYRFAKANDHYSVFKILAQRLTTQLIKQGFSKNKLADKCGAVFDERQEFFRKYGVRRDTFVGQCFWEPGPS